MKVAILASGSNGNATLIKFNNESFLIDDGLSFKELYSRILTCDFCCEEPNFFDHFFLVLANVVAKPYAICRFLFVVSIFDAIVYCCVFGGLVVANWFMICVKITEEKLDKMRG